MEEEKEVYNFNQADRERFLIAMIRTNFLKRLESSAYSLTLTLDRTIGKIDALLDKINRYESRQNAKEDLTETLPDDDEDDEEFLINRARYPYSLADLNLHDWKRELRQDKETLSAAHASVAQITPQRDGKLARIKKQIKDRAANPTTDRNGRENRKLLVFTTFKDTAEYLYDNLRDLGEQTGTQHGHGRGRRHYYDGRRQ